MNRPSGRPITLSLIVLFVALFAFAPRDSQAATPTTITLSPTLGPVGTSVVITGTSFSANIAISTITYEGIPVTGGSCAPGATHSDSGAAFSCTFTVPASTAGTQLVVASGSDFPSNSSDTATASFTLTAATQLITCTMANSAPPVTLALSESLGVNLSPNSVLCDGSSHSITADGSIILTATEPADTSTTRQRFGSELTTISTATCSSGDCPPWTFINYNQFLLSISYSVVGGGSPVAPSLTSTQFGITGSLSLTTAPLPYWLDSGTYWSVSNPTPGSTSTERYETLDATSGNVYTSYPLSFTYYHQYQPTLSYSVSGGGSPTVPTLTATQFGSAYVPPLTTGATGYWLDAGTSWSVPNPLGGSSATERWQTSATTSGTVGSAFTFTGVYYNQYSFNLLYSVSGGSPSAPTVTAVQFGGSYTPTLSISSAPYWLDAGTSWSVTNPLGGSDSTERWQSSQTVSGEVSSTSPTSAGGTFTFTYYHQFHVTFGYNVLGAGTGYSPPSVQIYQFGAKMSAFAGWADAGSSYSYTNPLNGSSSTERWYTGSAEGLVQSSSSVNATYYRQYDLVLSYKVVGGSVQPPPPTLNSTFLSLPLSKQLQATPTDYWLDSGSSWVVSTLLPGSGKNERWITDQRTEGSVVASSTVAFSYFDQYAAGLSYSIKGGGSPHPPSLNYTSFSAPADVTLSTTPVVYWLDYQSTWSLTNPIPGQSHSERWIAAQGTSGTAVRAFNETATYVHQYYLQVETNSKAGGFAEASSDWYNAGSSLPLNATASPGWRFSSWSGAGEGSYSGTLLTESVPINSAINETAVFYAGLTVTSGTGGSVQYRYGQVNGSVQGGSNATLYVSPGTSVSLSPVPATVAFTFRGWLGNLTGAAQSPSLMVTAPVSVSATFGLDYTDIGVFYVVAIVITVLTVYVFVVKRRHAIFGTGQVISSVS